MKVACIKSHNTFKVSLYSSGCCLNHEGPQRGISSARCTSSARTTRTITQYLSLSYGSTLRTSNDYTRKGKLPVVVHAYFTHHSYFLARIFQALEDGHITEALREDILRSINTTSGNPNSNAVKLGSIHHYEIQHDSIEAAK